MFSWFRKKTAEVAQNRSDVAQAAAEETQSFMMQIEGALGGFPRRMLGDPFIIGTVATHSAITCKVLTNGQCPLAITESAMIMGVRFTFMASAVSKEEALGALFQFKNHQEYTRASKAVTLILAAKYGKRDLAADPMLLETKKRLKGMPAPFRELFGANEAEQTASLLIQDLLVKPLKETYGDLWAAKT